MNLTPNPIFDNLLTFLVLSLLSLIISWLASAKSYFSLPYSTHPTPKIKNIDLFFNFFVFTAVYIFLAPFFFYGFYAAFDLQLDENIILSLVQIFIFLFTTLLLFIYALFQKTTVQKQIWKDYSFPGCYKLSFDIYFGIFTWLIAILPVLAISNLFEALSLSFFGPTNTLQISVQYLISSLKHPFSFFIAFFSVIIAAPLLEEFLFRGILLNWLRNKIPPLIAFSISSLIFAFFHYAPSQGSTNLTLIPTLFTFSLFLCFVYEKTRSLFSNIFLHSIFNLISALRIIFF